MPSALRLTIPVAIVTGLPTEIAVPSICVTVNESPSTSVSPISTGMITEPPSATVNVSSSAIGGSFTGVTLTVIVLGEAANALASPTENVKVVYGEPFSLASGRNFRLPDVMFAEVMICPEVTATPLSNTVPSTGSESMRTRASEPPSTSLNGKSVVANVKSVSSAVVTVRLPPVGASLTGVTLTVIVLAEAANVLASPTENVKVVYGDPFSFVSGRNFRFPAVMFAAVTICPAVTATPLSNTVPSTGNVSMRTRASDPPSTSLNGKSDVVNVKSVSSAVVTVRLPPVGASFTGVTLTVIVLAEAAKVVASPTENVKVVYGEPFSLASGRNFRLPDVTLAAVTICPAVTAIPLSSTVPSTGRVLMRTRASGSPSTSLNGKSDVVKVKSVSSAVVTVRLPPVGASFTGVTLTVCVAVVLKAVPSLTWKPNGVYGEPLPFNAGVKTRLPRLATGMT